MKKKPNYEKIRARAIKAMMALEEQSTGQVAMQSMRQLWTKIGGAANLDGVYRKELAHVYKALSMGLRDGII